MTDTPCRRRCSWRPRRRRNRGLARRTPAAGTDRVQTAAGAMQPAIGLLTASLDPLRKIRSWRELTPDDKTAIARRARRRRASLAGYLPDG
jgi:hypothetical protein